ncbi:tripartite motif-containing protein 15 [Ursus maritimus]|uniref:Tripartite motif-containing protein 15 n=1 Tax=Ursus maritimus TaxID=29073 RepID=A0A8M1H0D5_URSMA|nr:tripartite motif-containing protein 15 [Ursus maritimus]
MPSMPSQEETPCPGCTGPLKDVVTGTCGHTFSRSRLLPPSQMGAQPSCQVLLCVLCKEKEPMKPLVVPVPLGPLGETCCEEHGEKVYFFCETDAEFLCVACREGPSHRTHAVGVLDGAAQPYRDHLQSQMDARSLEKKQMECTRRREDEKLQELLTHMHGKKQQVDEAFGRLRQELADHQCLLQARLRELERQIHLEGEAYTSRLSEEIAGLGAQVQALGEQLQWPVSALLQDVRASPSRYETKTFVTPETISPDLVKKIRDLHRKILPLPEMLRTFSENLAHYLDTDSGAVSLDPGTARWSPGLPDDWKPAKLTRDKQDLPHSPLRSQGVPAARGCPGCPSGRHPRPGARGEAVGVAGEEAGSEGAGPELRPRRPDLEGVSPAAPGAHLPDSAPPRSGTPPSPPASGQTPLLRGLGNRFLLD